MTREDFHFAKRGMLLIALLACIGGASLLAVGFLSKQPGLVWVTFIPAAFGFYALAWYGFFGLIETLYNKEGW
jgi:hypothetical protein